MQDLRNRMEDQDKPQEPEAAEEGQPAVQERVEEKAAPLVVEQAIQAPVIAAPPMQV